MRRDPNNQWYIPFITNRLKFIDMWYPFEDIRKYDGKLNFRSVEARPHYLILDKDQSPSEYGQSVLVHELEDNRIYRLVESLPMAFKVNFSELKSSTPEELKRKDVIELTPLFINTDSIELIAEGGEQDILVVLVTKYPGWKLHIDGKPAKIENVGGYLATPMIKGVHKYRFDFQPFPFYFGALISLISFGFALVIIREDLVLGGKKIGALLASIWRWLREFTRLIVSRLRSNPAWLISALYREGVIELQERPNIHNHSTVSLLVMPLERTDKPVATVWKFWKITSWLLIREFIKTLSLPIILFVFAASIYLISRTISLADFPIYFFTDEAIQTVSAADLVRDGFYGPDKIFLPTYFPNGSYWNLSLSVYVQVLPYLLFGKSVFVTRFTSLLLSGLIVLVLVVAMRRTIGQRAWWSLILFLAVTPTWFLHSRTAFETVLFSGLYAGFLGAYLLYLQQSPRYLYLAILMAALAFYAYSPGQVVIAVSAVALFVADFRYHWQNRSFLGKGLLFVLLLAAPYLRFLSYHQEAPFQHLRNLDSYWFYDFPLTEKILRYLKEYLMGLNPYYWFIPHSIDLNRHTMKGYGHLGFWNLPFIVLGLIYTLRQWRRPPYRVFLIAWLAVPSGAALVGVGITRLLAMVMPMAVFATLGWEWILSLIPQIRWQKVAQVVLFVFLGGVAFSMTNDSLRNGPTWYEDYGLYGMQYGARQVFEQKIPEFLARDPQTQLFVSSLWANGADVFVRYFLTPQQAQRVSLGSIDSYLSRKQALDERTIFILTAEELRAALASPKMRFLRTEDEILYPNGKIGFYIVRLAYVDNVDELFARELEQRRQLVNAHIIVDGISAIVRYSQIDDGELGNLFDQKPETLMRGREANPFILEFEFVQPQSLKGLQARFGSMDFELVLYLYPAGQTQPIELRQEYRGLPPDPAIEFLFPEPTVLGKLRLQIRDLNYGEFANIHIRELKFLK
jgi:4-amino-4-deoxy-L-arabinose transferase-like glycosyltransferase